MTNEQLKNKILEFEPSAIVEQKQYLTATVEQSKLFNLAKKLKEDKETFFDYLFNLTGVDYIKNMGVVYFLTSSELKHIVVLKTTTNSEKPNLDSVCTIWKTAEFHEREVYDLLGIKFNNHPDLRRIFLEDDWVGHPLRKNYVDEINIIER